MSSAPRIVVFSTHPVRRAYFSAIVQAAGFSLAKNNASADAGLGDDAQSAALSGLPSLIFGHEDKSRHDVNVRILSSPVRAARLISALQALVRKDRTESRLDVSGYILDLEEGLWHAPAGAVPVRLTEKEVAILRYLYASASQGPATREALLSHVWSYADSVETHTLETHIYRLRQKIEQDPGNPRIIVTSGDGYMLGMDEAP